MISFVKFVAVFSAGMMAAAAWAAKTGDAATPTPTPQPSATDAQPDADAAPKKRPNMNVPIEKGHDAKGLTIPYFNNTGKRDMNFVIAVASRIDDDHLRLTDLQIETFNDDGEHDLSINLPTSIFNTETSVITTNKHATILRSDFELTGETMIFNTRTKQGGLGGRVRMLIYNLKDETGESDRLEEDKAKASASKTEVGATPTASSTAPANTPKPKANTPKSKAK